MAEPTRSLAAVDDELISGEGEMLTPYGREMVSRHGEALAHLLVVLDGAAELLRVTGATCDASIVEAHRAQLARGAEWPGDPVNCACGTCRASEGEGTPDAEPGEGPGHA